MFAEYVGMPAESDGTMRGDIDASFNRIMFGELIRGFIFLN